MKKIKLIVLSSLILILSACGGGSSSGGGVDTLSDDDGVFNGVAEVTTNAEGLFNSAECFDIGFVIENDVITSFTLDGVTAAVSIPLTDNSFSFGDMEVMEIMMDATSCTTPTILSGTVSNAMIIGRIDGTSDCDLFDEPFIITIDGEFTASR